MQTKSWALATAFALSISIASAEKPRIYFPREVRRQFDNVTRAEPTTTRGGLLDEVLDPILGGGDATTSDVSSPTSSGDDAILIGPSGIINLPGLFSSDATTPSNPTGTGAETETSSDDKPSVTNSADENSVEPTSTRGRPDSILDPILGEDSTRAPAGPGTEDASATASDISDEVTDAPSSTQRGNLDPVETLTSDVVVPDETTTAEATETDSDQSTEATEAPTTTRGGGMPDRIETLISDILNPPVSTQPVANETESASEPSSTSNIISEILPSLTLFPPESTTTDPVPTDTDIVSEEPTATTTATLIPTDVTFTLPGSETSTTSSSEPTGPVEPTTTETVEPTGPTEVPGNGTTTEPSQTTVIPTDITTDLPTSEPTSTPTESTNEPPPVGSTTETATELPTSTTDVTLPTLSPTTDASEDTSTSTKTSSAEEPTKEPATSVPPKDTTSDAPTETETETKNPVTSIRPTATYSSTDDWLPTTIVADATTFTFTRPTQDSTGTTTQALPTDIPKKIMPNNPAENAPDGTRLINIGFKFPLNYNHVAKNPVAAAQIFQLLPQALATAGNIKTDKVRVSMLVPYDTRDKWGFVTTLAKVYYPEALLDQLRMDIDDPNSLVYNTDVAVVNDLTADIESRIDFFGNITGEDDDGSEAQPTGSEDTNNTIDSGENNKSEGSTKDQATTAGIAVGAFGLAALYGGAMFIVARRYKRKRQGHRRTSSVTGSDFSSEMQYTRNGSPAMMGGALMSQDMSHYGAAGGYERDSHGSGPSARTANISAPVAAENSLGWN